ncbi:MAG: cobyrinate a,c-diamide synthase [Actinomycetota bacterium]
MVALPRLVISAPSTGQGKTTIATGLMAALRMAGFDVSGHKVGPDYIDPGYHSLATGRPARNLDPHLVGAERLVPLLLHGASGADIAIIEGAMGLYDGRLGTDGFSSTAHVAVVTKTPVVVVLDIAAMSRTAAAIVAGLVAYDEHVTVVGVILNRAGSARNTTEIARALERTGVPVVGVVPRDETLSTPSRHLGLVPVAERAGSVHMIERLGQHIACHVDLDAIVDSARTAPDLTTPAWDPRHEVTVPAARHEVTAPVRTNRPLVAMAGGRAFTFRYTETEELLAAAGCQPVTFDPLVDPMLPAGTQGIYLGGGFPEVYAADLAANTSLLADVRAAIADGIPTVAECAGLLYLTRTLDEVPMAKVLAAQAVMTSQLTLRYPKVSAADDSIITRAGEQITGHEFHRTQVTPARGERAAWQMGESAVGFVTDTMHASYLHVHWAGYPQLAQRFADAVHAVGARRPRPESPDAAPQGGPQAHVTTEDQHLRLGSAGFDLDASAPPLVQDPLRHHGDREVTAGMVDFAVNVFDAPRPSWLDDALHAAVNSLDQYPNPEPARGALARWHGREPAEVLPTAGAAEVFSLLARWRPWRRPVIVDPQFTEPHAALATTGHRVGSARCAAESGFAFSPEIVPLDADLVVIGNPTNPTGVLHPARLIRQLCRPGRVVVVDEAFMDAVPGETESFVAERIPGLLVVRSLTKHWSIPGVRAGYVVGDRAVVAGLAALQPPWSVSTPAIAAIQACLTPVAHQESHQRAMMLTQWRTVLEQGLRQRGIAYIPSAAPFMLVRVAPGVYNSLRDQGVTVRRADTFPGLDASWVRIAVRPPARLTHLFTALDAVLVAGREVAMSPARGVL